MKDKVSLIKWNDDTMQSPSDESLLIVYKDDSGDSVNYYTAVARKIYKDNHWIVDNAELFHEVILWSRLPQIEDIHNIK